ncbi:MarR family transcriptional regulator [Tamaricihabitans halophyticus]|uniref:MarR family transcriptional regulator n=1 Tax=Tamaricihabitans halophyticus TaxID=1262583 RepID=A0A4R2PZD1_9PSEU|nr:MarR family transcriptional regulator [Tamaricihabitans halophyticus]
MRWLTEREQRVWRAYLQATWMLSEHLGRQLQQESGIPHTYYEILVALSEAPNRTLRMSDLASACRASRSRLSHAVAKLERTGWVRRSTCDEDKRGAWASLTEAGFAALERAAPGHVTAVREYLFDVLTEEQVDVLGQIGQAIQDGLSGECAKALEQVEEVYAADSAELPEVVPSAAERATDPESA